MEYVRKCVHVYKLAKGEIPLWKYCTPGFFCRDTLLFSFGLGSENFVGRATLSLYPIPIYAFLAARLLPFLNERVFLSLTVFFPFTNTATFCTRVSLLAGTPDNEPHVPSQES